MRRYVASNVLLITGFASAEKPVPGISKYVLDYMLLLWLETTKQLTQSLDIARALWLQYYPWSRGIKIDVATQEGSKISMMVVRPSPLCVWDCCMKVVQ